MKNIKTIEYTNIAILGGIVFFAFIVRIFKIESPFLGNFAVRAAEYAMIAEKFLQGAPVFKPTIYQVVNGSPSYVFFEFPLFVYIAALAKSASGLSMEFCGRFMSIIYTCFSIILLYHIVRRYFGEKAALIAAAAFSLSPSILIYGRSFHAEPFVIMALLLAIHTYLKYLEAKDYRFYAISLISFSIALLDRLQLTWYLVFLIWFIDYSYERRGPVISTRFLIYLFLGLLLPLAWYGYAIYAVKIYPNVVYSIQHQVNTRAFPSPLLLKPEFYTALFDYLVSFAFNPVGFFILLYGLLNRLKERKEFVFYLWVVLVFVTYFLIPQKIIDHNYYFPVAVVPLSVFFSIGLNRLIESRFFDRTLFQNRTIVILAVIFYIGASMRYYAHPAFKLNAEDQRVLRIARAVKSVTDKHDRIILANGGSTPLLYYCQRDGAYFSFADPGLDEYQSQKLAKTFDEAKMARKRAAAKEPINWLEYFINEEGMNYLVCYGNDLSFFKADTNIGEFVRQNYLSVFQDDDCVIFKLKKGTIG